MKDLTPAMIQKVYGEKLEKSEKEKSEIIADIWKAAIYKGFQELKKNTKKW